MRTFSDHVSNHDRLNLRTVCHWIPLCWCSFIFCSFPVQPYKGWIEKAKVQGASGKFLGFYTRPTNHYFRLSAQAWHYECLNGAVCGSEKGREVIWKKPGQMISLLYRVYYGDVTQFAAFYTKSYQLKVCSWAWCLKPSAVNKASAAQC